MATRLKTVEYWFPMLQSVTDLTDTNLTQITVYLPESSKAFKSVILEMVYHDRNTTLGNINRQQVSLQLGAAGYSAVNNTNALTNGGEQQTVLMSGDFTSYFTTNWSGSSMTCDARILADSAVASPLNPAFNNVSARLIITYEYDGTSATQVKTVRIPLDCKVTTADTSKGSAIATIPALDTELPEASKTYRQFGLVLQAQDSQTSTTDMTWNMQVDSLTAFTSGVYEHGSTVAMFVRMNFNLDITGANLMSTNATHSFYYWCNSAGNHPQAWMYVTYEFDATSANDVYVSLLLPAEVSSPMGGTTSSDYQRSSRELFIEEGATITTKKIAVLAFWDQLTAISGLNFRVGTGSFVAYTDNANVMAGSNAAMVRNDGAFTLARGRNTLTFDVYRTDTSDVGYNVGLLWMVNYTCAKPSGGHGAENHTVLWGLKAVGTTAAGVQTIVSSTAITIPETSYFITALGMEYRYVPSGTVACSGAAVGVERLASGEDGLIWEGVYADLGGTDGETGIYHAIAQMRTIFKRWPNDADSSRLDIETARRWRAATSQSVSSLDQLLIYATYHAITFTVGGDVSASGGGTVNLYLTRNTSGERVLVSSRSGNGAYSFTWYDNTENLYVDAYEDSTHLGRSAIGTATGSP